MLPQPLCEIAFTQAAECIEVAIGCVERAEGCSGSAFKGARLIQMPNEVGSVMQHKLLFLAVGYDQRLSVLRVNLPRAWKDADLLDDATQRGSMEEWRQRGQCWKRIALRSSCCPPESQNKILLEVENVDKENGERNAVWFSSKGEAVESIEVRCVPLWDKATSGSCNQYSKSFESSNQVGHATLLQWVAGTVVNVSDVGSMDASIVYSANCGSGDVSNASHVASIEGRESLSTTIIVAGEGFQTLRLISPMSSPSTAALSSAPLTAAVTLAPSAAVPTSPLSVAATTNSTARALLLGILHRPKVAVAPNEDSLQDIGRAGHEQVGESDAKGSALAVPGAEKSSLRIVVPEPSSTLEDEDDEDEDEDIVEAFIEAGCEEWEPDDWNEEESEGDESDESHEVGHEFDESSTEDEQSDSECGDEIDSDGESSHQRNKSSSEAGSESDWENEDVIDDLISKINSSPMAINAKSEANFSFKAVASPSPSPSPSPKLVINRSLSAILGMKARECREIVETPGTKEKKFVFQGVSKESATHGKVAQVDEALRANGIVAKGFAPNVPRRRLQNPQAESIKPAKSASAQENVSRIDLKLDKAEHKRAMQKDMQHLLKHCDLDLKVDMECTEEEKVRMRSVIRANLDSLVSFHTQQRPEQRQVTLLFLIAGR